MFISWILLPLLFLLSPSAHAADELRVCDGKIDMYYRGSEKIRIVCGTPPFVIFCDQTYGGFGRHSINCEQIGLNLQIHTIRVEAQGFTAYNANGEEIASGLSPGLDQISHTTKSFFRDSGRWLGTFIPALWSAIQLFTQWVWSVVAAGWDGVAGWFHAG